MKILPFPYWGRKIRNLRAMYFAPLAAGWELVKEVDSVDHLMVDIQGLAPGDAVHINGLRPFGTALAANPALADTIRQEFTKAKANGIKLIWSLHHVLTPDSETPAEDLLIHQILAQLADAIVIPHKQTLAAIGDLYQLDLAKLCVIPNSSYLGLFADDESDAAARKQFGIPEKDWKTVGYLSNYATFANLNLFVDAMKIVEAQDAAVSTVIRCRFAEGEADEEVETDSHPENSDDFDNSDVSQGSDGYAAPAYDAAREIVTELRNAVAKFRYLPRNRINRWYRACDLIVFPEYRDMDPNPLLIAATFARRVLIPADTTLAAVYKNESWVHTYEAPQPGQSAAEALAAGIISALKVAESAEPVPGVAGAGSRAAWRFARKQTPFALSRAYLRLLESR